MIASVVRLTDTTFDQNRAEMNGGAVAAKQDSIIKLVDGSNTFQSNSATNGGAIYLVSNSSYVTHSTGDSSRRRLATTAEDDRFARELQGEYSFNYTYELIQLQGAWTISTNYNLWRSPSSAPHADQHM